MKAVSGAPVRLASFHASGSPGAVITRSKNEPYRAPVSRVAVSMIDWVRVSRSRSAASVMLSWLSCSISEASRSDDASGDAGAWFWSTSGTLAPAG